MRHRNQLAQNVVLYKTKSFRFSIAIPFIAALTLSALICLDNVVVFSFRVEDISALFEVFKLPLIILGLTVPLTALSAAVHRSEQTARQIHTQTEQNNFANHFKHLEEFKAAIGDKTPKIWKSTEDFHRDMYPDTISGSISPIYLDIQGNKYLKALIYRAEQNPVDLMDICTTIYFEISDKLMMNRVPNRFENISPSDILDLLEGIQKAYSFSGLHSPPYKINESLARQILRLQSLADSYTNYKGNSHIIWDKLFANNEKDPFDRIGSLLMGNTRYAPLATAYAWKEAVKKNPNFAAESYTLSVVNHWRDELYPSIRNTRLSDIDPTWETFLTMNLVSDQAL